MLKVIKSAQAYVANTNGNVVVAVVFDTTTKEVKTLVNWGAYMNRGNLYLSQYTIYEYASFKEAIEETCRRYGKDLVF